MSHMIVGNKYFLKTGSWQSWMGALSDIKPDSIFTLKRIEDDGIHLFESPTGKPFYVEESRVQWYDEKSAMREIPKADNGTRPNLLAVDESWLLPAGTFFRVNGKHTPLYLVMSNSHVFNLTEKQMHTTCSSRFKDVQLSVANVQLSEVL